MTDFSPRAAASAPPLAAGEVHVWSVRLDPPAAEVERLGRFLSPDEWERANRFRFDRHRRQYVVGRGALRTLLGAYTGRAPEAVRFTYGHRGKPFLEPPLADPAAGTLHFNLSNSDELALVGFVLGPEIGVDVVLLR